MGALLKRAAAAQSLVPVSYTHLDVYKRQVFDHAGKAALAFYLFFMGSGFGFFYFLGGRGNFSRIFTAFYETPTNYVAENIVWVNPIVDLLVLSLIHISSPWRPASCSTCGSISRSSARWGKSSGPDVYKRQAVPCK